ncbi:MAG TPA: hypothetical protein VG944_19425 [Fimbriimonas sp.]|nr:hypothetical protein [Fimbriimonas sp.]
MNDLSTSLDSNHRDASESAEAADLANELKIAPRFAKWRSRPTHPPTWRTRLKEARWERLAFPVFAILLVLVLGWYWAQLPPVFRMILRVPSYAVFGFILLANAKVWSRRPHALVVRMLDIPCPNNQFAGHVSFTGKGMTLGKDEGVITFTEGWLHFEGLRTSFSLKPDGVELKSRSMSRESISMRFIPRTQAAKMETHSLSYSLANIDFHLTIAPFDRAVGNDPGLRDRFSRAIRAWKEGSAPREGEALFPPLGQAFDARKHVRIVAIVAGFLASAILAALISCCDQMKAFEVCILAVAALCALGAVVVYCRGVPREADAYAKLVADLEPHGDS